MFKQSHDTTVEAFSPLTGSRSVRHLRRISTDGLQGEWKRIFQVDLSQEWLRVEFIDYFECLDTGLKFFLPKSAAGSGEFYAQLQDLDWYYMPHKWEHEMALLDIKSGDNVLEVGCGFGDYVERLVNKKHCQAEGIELNRSAVTKAQSLGRPVSVCSIEEKAKTEPNTFDVVCHFEVLEHVIDPLMFLEDCIRCLKVGGRLQIAVPNMDSFIRYNSNNLLNQPPHHMTQWYPYTFRTLSSVLPLQLDKIVYEPLAPYHVDYYLRVMLDRIVNVRYAKALGTRFLFGILRPVLNLGARRWVRGQTLYASFRKLG